MILRVRWTDALIGIALLIAPGGMSWPQQSNPPQSPSQRDDPATSGAGPTSGAPGLRNYDPPKGGSVTTDSRGVTTFQPSQSKPKADAPLDQGNESVDTIPPK